MTPGFSRTIAAATLALSAAACATRQPAAGATPATDAAAFVVRNNHDVAYAGPLEVRTQLPDGVYTGTNAQGEVRAGVARVVVSLAPQSSVQLRRATPLAAAMPFIGGSFTVKREASRLLLQREGSNLAMLEIGIAHLADTTATVDDAVRAFTPLALAWRTLPDGRLHGATTQDGYRVEVTATPYGTGFLDARATLTRVDSMGPRSYVAVVRRVSSASAPANARLRFNGRTFQTGNSPSTWDRDFWYTRGVDWTSWALGNTAVVATSGFTPVPTILNSKGVWAEGSHFYVWERTRQAADAMYLVSEIAGPNTDQATSRYMPIRQYAPMHQGDSLTLTWRLAFANHADTSWAESQMLAFAGYRRARTDAGTTAGTPTIDVGVPAVAFGTSYFPYSTFNENFDFYRLPGTNQETWWPISKGQWTEWRKYVPRMQTDLHIVRAMGFDWVRLHHLELLHHLDHQEAWAFLDWYMNEVRGLGLMVLIDSEGPARWIAQLVGRYPDLIKRLELENEILIGGIKPGDPARWTELYNATKQVSPDIDVFLTTAGNHGQFERLRALGVPFDRVGLHAYKHGPEWKESYSSHALGTGGYASSIDREATLGEFNWKEYTRMSPETRAEHVRETYRHILAPRALPELFQFHFQETMSISPAISRSGVRHYEPLHLDRRLKLEGEALRDAIRQYTRVDAPVRVLPIETSEVEFADGKARARFRMTNGTRQPMTVRLRAYAFDGTEATVVSPAEVTLPAGGSQAGEVALALPAAAKPGTYHYFIRADYGDDYTTGWGVAANLGVPAFAPTVLGERVAYVNGADPASLDWTRPIAVTYPAKAPVLEMEMGYLLANTLQAATGRRIRLSSDADLLPEHRAAGLVIAVGAKPGVHADSARGVVAIEKTNDGQQTLVVTGTTRQAVQAAATDLLLRYWPSAKDSGLGISGREPGQLLGQRANVTNPDPP